MDKNASIPCRIVFKAVATTPDEIRKGLKRQMLILIVSVSLPDAHFFTRKNVDNRSFNASKPLMHLHTQFNCDIPWDSIDMDFMNLNQAAHGDREYGFIGARMRISRKVVVGYWEVRRSRRIAAWMRASVGYIEGKNLKIARFGDNMREVAVTEGDKVEAQIKFGWSINGYGIGDLIEVLNDVSDQSANVLLKEYEEKYDIAPEGLTEGPVRDAIRYQAKLEIALKTFLEEGGFGAFTTTFEVLHGLKQLPGLAVQRLMEAGYGFGAEGDWKTSGLVRIMKLMASGLDGGTSFMEDYTYHFEPGNSMILGAHMLEVCPTIAATRPRIEVHPLGIGGKADPARVVFNGKAGKAIAASLIDLGDRFRLLVNDVDAVDAEKDLPKLPVARVLWKPMPSLHEAAEAWILAGGAHHTSFSYDLTAENMLDWAEIANIECVLINKDTDLLEFKNSLKLNDIIWRFH